MERNIWQILAFGALMAVCAQPLSARQLSANDALRRAVKSEQSVPMGMRKSPVNSRMKLVHTSLTERELAPALYVFESEKGGVLIASADDRLQPVLGVSDSGTFGEMPENMKWWLSQYEEEIAAYYEANGTEEAAGTFESVYDYYASWEPLEPICKTEWDQMGPFNALCPTVNGTETATGCVATCLAQAIRAIGYMHPSGSKTYSNENLGWTVSFDFNSYKPDFSLLRDAYKGGATQAQRDEVAKLMYACGVAVNSSYNVAAKGGTGAVFDMNGIRQNLGFFDSFTVKRSGMPTAEWEKLVYEIIKLGKPLCYGGSGSGGHAFICDGYSEDGMFHFNWGWSGTSNGYYRLSALNPRNQGVGSFQGGYTMGQNFTVLVGDDDKDLVFPSFRPGLVEWNGNNALSATYGVDKTGKNYFSLENFQYWLTGNSTPGALEVGLGLLLKDRDGISEDIYLAPDRYNTCNTGYGGWNFTVTFDKSILAPDGKYDAYPVYSFKGYDGYWLSTNVYNAPQYDHWYVKVSSKEITCRPASERPLCIDVYEMEANQIYSTDNKNTFHCLISNFSESDFAEPISLCLFNEAGEKVSEIAKSYMLISAGETASMDATFTTNNVAAGKYQLCIYRDNKSAALSDNAKLDVEILSGKRPDTVNTPELADNYQVGLWVNGASQALQPVSIVAGAEISGTSCVITAESQTVDYSLAIFKHGETTDPIAKYHVAETIIKGNNTWIRDADFSIKPDLAVGAYSMAFVNEKDGLVSAPADLCIGVQKDGLIYNYDIALGGLVISGVNGTMPEEINVPAEVDGTPVVGIGNSAFDHCIKVREISLPASIKKIGHNAFRGASSLKHVMMAGKDVPFENAAIAFGSVNPAAEFYVDGESYASYKSVFKYRGRLYASISEIKLPEETVCPAGMLKEVGIESDPAENCNPNFSVKVADPSVLDAEVVDGKIVLNPKAQGETSVTLISAQPGVEPAVMAVKVEAAPELDIEIILSDTEIELEEEQTKQLSADLKNAPAGASALWTSSDETVAKVSATGLVTAVGVGEAEITATCGNATAKCKVKVTEKAPDYGLKINKSDLKLNEGEVEWLWYEFSGNPPKDIDVEWATSDPNVATVNMGKVTAVSAGMADITATCGPVVATCHVLVVNPYDSIDEISADSDAEFFDLKGQRVVSPRGIVIVRKDGNTKLILRK